MIVFVVDNIFLVQIWVDLNHEFSKAAFEEHEGFFVVVCIEERTRDINGGNVALLMSVNGGSDHDAVGGNSWGSTIFLLLSKLTSFLAAIGTGLCPHPSISFLNDIHEGGERLSAFIRG